MFLISFVLILICILISVAFITLLERSVLGYIQLRKGPGSVGYMGLMQPFSDGLKLFFKEQIYPLYSNFYIYYISPVLMLISSFVLWVLFPYVINVYSFNFGMLFFLCCMGMNGYWIILAGWGSNSNYSFLGALRSLAQVISYEVCLALIIICYMIFVFSFNLISFMKYQIDTWFIMFSLPMFFCWVSSCLAEMNRSPFDFAEGESELVSGFNIEYSGGGFAFIFLSEYMNIVFMSVMTCIVFLGCNLWSFFFYFKIILLIFLFIWVRGTLPRYRYDMLMYLAWKVFLPLSLSYMLFYMGFVLCL